MNGLVCFFDQNRNQIVICKPSMQERQQVQKEKKEQKSSFFGRFQEFQNLLREVDQDSKKDVSK